MNPYKIIKLNESILLRAFNFVRMLKIPVINRHQTNLINANKGVEKIENGKSCYVLMGGLSVKNINLDLMSKYDIITANHFFRTDDYLRLRPKYHVITDPNFFENDANIKDLTNMIQSFTTVFLNIKKNKIVNKVNFKYILPMFRVVDERLKMDISKACSNFSTVTLACIQIAIFLGYRKIYLVGFDLPPGHMPHYYKESEVEIEGSQTQRDKIDEFDYCSLFWQYTNCHHEAYKIQCYAKKNNIEIYNTSPSSYVRAFPYCSFSES